MDKNFDEVYYNEVYESTKDFGRTQFIREIIMLQNKIKELESINSSMELELAEKITELETQKSYEEELIEMKNNIRYFMFKLKLDGCYTKELEEFINNYGRGLFY